MQCQHLREWSAPGLLLIGDAAHPMSPVGGQGINVALRDAVVAANHLVPVITGGGLPADIAAACRRTERERLPEVRTIQRLQRVPPRILMQKTPASRFVVRRVLPTLARVGALALPLVGFARRFARGTADVTLRV